MRLITPPPDGPNSTDAPLRMTENSLIDSWESASGARPSADPNVPPKNPLSKSMPSSVVFVLIPRWPETRTVPRLSGSLRVSGVRRTRSW